MQTSQLGRILLSNTSSSSDEMRAGPDEVGRYDGLDELLGEVSARVPRGERPAKASTETPVTRV